MLNLVWERPEPVHHSPDVPRLWVVFFRDSGERSWLDFLTRPGFRHVSAAAWYDRTERWVFVDPAFRATVIQVIEAGPAADAVFGHWVSEAGAVLRVRSRADRWSVPGLVGCVGQVKALLGLRSRALLPFTLFQHLLARGAEPVEVPRSESIGQPIQAGRSARGPEGRSPARA